MYNTLKVGIISLFFIITIALGCKKNATPDILLDTSSQLVSLTVNMEQLRVRKAPGLDGAEIGKVTLGSELPYAGRMTDFTTRIKLDGIWYDEPWVSILTSEQDTGWIYGGGVVFEGENSEELSEILLQKRMKTFFGKLSSDIALYRDDYANALTSEEFAKVFHDGEEIRERMVAALEEKIPITEVENLPDIFWVENVFPGYLVELVAEGSQYYLFKDFRQLHTKAQQTEGLEDDVFMDLALAIYERDSIEYFFPSWFMQTWDYGGHSLLGSGKHNDVLALADEVMEMSDYFKEDIDVFKKEVMRDISNPELTYWNGAERIVAELDDIIDMEYALLSKDDIISLKARRNQFKNYEANGIELNLRTGEGLH